MNKTFEPLRGSWIASAREIVEDSRNYVRSVAGQIPVELRDTLLSIVRFAEEAEECCDQWNDACYKALSQELQEKLFIEEQLKGLLQAIRATKDADSIPALRTAARDTCDRIRDWKYKAEQERLQAASSAAPPRPSPPLVPKLCK